MSLVWNNFVFYFSLTKIKFLLPKKKKKKNLKYSIGVKDIKSEITACLTSLPS